MKKTSKRVFGSMVTLAMLGSAFQAQALTPTFSVLNNFQPTSAGPSRFITLYDAQNLQQREWMAGFYLDYAKNPLELAAPIGVRQSGVINNLLTGNFLGAYAFTNWLTAGVRVPVVFYNDYQGLPNTVARALAERDFSMGDIGLDFKVRLLDTKRFGLAVIPFIGIPTGRSTTFVGDGGVTGGAKIAAHFDAHERVRIGLNVGYKAKKGVLIRGLDADDLFSVGLGVNVKLMKRLDLIAEAHTETVAKDFFKSEVQTPFEVLGALRFHATDDLDITAGGGPGLTNGFGSPDFRVFLGVNYTRHNREKPAERPAPRVEKTKVKISDVIHFEFDKSTIKRESYAVLDDVVKILKDNPSIKNIRIEGHTDSVGSDAYNMKLSQRRAEAVRSYFISKGIDASRLEAKGFGETRPLADADNRTAEGRAKNRRTEFHTSE